MRQSIGSVVERPGRLVGLFVALVAVYLLLDVAYLTLVTGVTVVEALLEPTGYDLFTRIAVVLLAAFAATVVEFTLIRYRRIARELEAEQVRLRTLYEKNPSAIVTLNKGFVVSYVNDQAAETVGLPAEQIIGHACHKAIIGLDEPCEGCLVGQVFATGKAHSRIKHETTTAGRENWLSQVWYPLMAPDGSVESVVEIASDVSAVKLDPLTSLPNRLLLRDRLEIALASAKRHGQLMAVLYMDIDGFKRVNDTLGHAAGDALLAGFAERLRGIVRQDETLSRIGGDEFVLLLPSIMSREEVGHTASRVLEQLSAPFILGGREHPITASIGVAFFEGGEASAEELLHFADQAMYAAKKQGGNTYRTAADATGTGSQPAYS